jgi:hypothetical protein
VVLQEQSQVPTIEYDRYNSMYPAANYLDYFINSQGSQTILFMTWGREFGGQQTIGDNSSPLFSDFFNMQDSLRAAYEELAASLSARVAPVGLACARAYRNDSSFSLWQYDGSHPSVKGSYLAACVFYACFLRESPAGLSYAGGLWTQTKRISCRI